jgi:hypothetical protein
MFWRRATGSWRLTGRRHRRGRRRWLRGGQRRRARWGGALAGCIQCGVLAGWKARHGSAIRRHCASTARARIAELASLYASCINERERGCEVDIFDCWLCCETIDSGATRPGPVQQVELAVAVWPPCRAIGQIRALFRLGGGRCGKAASRGTADTGVGDEVVMLASAFGRGSRVRSPWSRFG